MQERGLTEMASWQVPYGERNCVKTRENSDIKSNFSSNYMLSPLSTYPQSTVARMQAKGDLVNSLDNTKGLSHGL